MNNDQAMREAPKRALWKTLLLRVSRSDVVVNRDGTLTLTTECLARLVDAALAQPDAPARVLSNDEIDKLVDARWQVDGLSVITRAASRNFAIAILAASTGAPNP